VGRGTFVTNLSADRVIESMTLLLRNEPDNVAKLQEARELLEVSAARLAASRRTEANVERLRAISAEIEQERSVSPRLIDGDTEFHVEVARATGNPVLALLNQTIVALLRSERLERTDVDDELASAFASHRAIVDAIAEGDGDRAAQAMSEHLDFVATRHAHAPDGNGAARVAS
jgi:GntR family transcriptional repressor for pyruvate dehydrogenase complex